jgi:hypothetical protein
VHRDDVEVAIQQCEHLVVLLALPLLQQCQQIRIAPEEVGHAVAEEAGRRVARDGHHFDVADHLLVPAHRAGDLDAGAGGREVGHD